MKDKNYKYPGKSFRVPMDESVSKYEQEIKQNPEDAAAYAGLAEALIVLWCYGFISRDESIPKAKEATNRALEIDENLGDVHTALGIVKLSAWDWAGSEQELKLGLDLNPENSQAHHWYALYLSAMGKHKQALEISHKAVSLSPVPYSDIGHASIYYFAHQFEKMVEVLTETIKKDPELAPAYDWLGMAYCQLKQFGNSIEVYRKAVELSDGLAEIKAGLGHAYGMAGRNDEAKQVLDEFQSLAEKYYIPPVQIAYVAASLNDIELTFELLERAYRERSWELSFIREEPWFDDFHSNPRFIDLLNRIQFPEKE